MSAKDPISAESISDWIGVECPSEVKKVKILIHEALGIVKVQTGLEHGAKGERVEYIRGWPEVVSLNCTGRDCDDIKWTLEVHEGGLWVRHHGATQIGDTICIGGKCDCSCDCNACDGAPQLRLITWPACGETPTFVTAFVRKYVAYHYMNRGDTPDAKAERDLLSILRPFMPIAAC